MRCLFHRVVVFCALSASVGVPVTQAQNLIPNGSFEEFNTSCGFGNLGYNNLLDWTIVDCGNSLGLGHVCNGSVPLSEVGYQQPEDGLAFISTWPLIMHATGGYPDGNPRQYATVNLTQALTVGQHYCLSLWMNRADSSNYTTSDYNAFFWYDVPTTCNDQDDQWDTYAAVSFDISQVDTADWTYLVGEFTATDPYTNVTFGAFQQGAEIDSVFLHHNANLANGEGDVAQYFIDNIQLWACQVGVNGSSDGSAVELFPNPVSDVLNVSLRTGNPVRFTVCDAVGREQVGVWSGHWSGAAYYEMDVRDLASGQYVLVAFDDHGRVFSRPFIVAH